MRIYVTVYPYPLLSYVHYCYRWLSHICNHAFTYTSKPVLTTTLQPRLIPPLIAPHPTSIQTSI